MLKILFVEDIATDLELAMREIKREKIECISRTVETETDFIRELNDFKPDMIISDYSMPEFDGMSALKIARKQSEYIPFIVLTGSMNEETAVACMKAGADDYVIKEKIRRLPFAVKEVLEINRIKKEKQKALQDLRDSNAKLRQITDNMTDVVWTCDLQGIINYVSPSIKKLVGVSPEEYKKMSLAEKHPSDTLQEFQAILEEEIEKEKTGNADKNRSRVIEVKHLKADGSVFYIGMHITFIRDEFGNPIGLQGVTRDITERIESEEKIKKNLLEKSLLLQELYHRTKNNMQVIASMMKMQSRKTNDTFLQQAFLDMINRIKSMALVHEKLYQSRNLSEINLKDYIQDLIKQIARSFLTGENTIKVVLDLEDIFIKIDSAIPLGLILSELISNVYKHAFPDGKKGSIAIKTFVEDDIIHLTLADNGLGIQAGKDLKKMKSIGLDTVFSLVEFQLKGIVNYTSENGLKWHIEFKDDSYKARV